MKAKLTGLTLGLAMAAVAAHPALAGGDVIYQGVKDPAAAIPVPAPIPIEHYAPEYYVRIDVGGSWLSGGTVEETGTPIDIHSSEDVETMEWGSIGAGRYITPSIRAEIAVDLSTKASLQTDGTQTFHIPSGSGILQVNRTEKIQYEQDFGMLNFYYDFRNGSLFTPYIGAGVGVSYRHLTRSYSESPSCPGGGCSGTFPDLSDIETDHSRWDLAASATAGVAIEVADDILWDTSYRYVWTNGGRPVCVGGVKKLTGRPRGPRRLARLTSKSRHGRPQEAFEQAAPPGLFKRTLCQAAWLVAGLAVGRVDGTVAPVRRGSGAPQGFDPIAEGPSGASPILPAGHRAWVGHGRVRDGAVDLARAAGRGCARLGSVRPDLGAGYPR